MAAPGPVDFSSHLLAVTERPPPPLARAVLHGLLLLLALILAWAWFGRLDIVARASGKLIPQTRVQVVQPLDGGRVARIAVEEGERVAKGQPMVVMDDLISRADTQQIVSEKKNRTLQLRRIDAQLAQQPFKRLPGDDADLYADVLRQYRENIKAHELAVGQQRSIVEQAGQELAAARQLLSKLRDTLPILKANEKAVSDLTDQGFASQMNLLEKSRERIETERDLKAQEFKVRSLRAHLEEARQRMGQINAAYHQDLLNDKVEQQQKLAAIEQELNKQEYRNRLLVLKAPGDGYVKDLATHTRGSVIPAGTVLLTIVPVGVPLLAEVLVQDRDAGFVRAGQRARIKVASFEFQKYGTIDAVVDHVSADASQARAGGATGNAGPSGYRAILSLGRQTLSYDGKAYAVKPGMQVTAEINLGSRTVMQYLFSPVTRAVREAGTER